MTHPTSGSGVVDDGFDIKAEALVAFLKAAKRTNATEATFSFHKSAKLENWCVEITIKQHDLCLEKDEAESTEEEGADRRGIDGNLKVYLCTVCHVEPVDAPAGFDTCQRCLKERI